MKDTLAALHVPATDLTDARLYATVQERVAQLKLAPQVEVYSAPKAGLEVFDARTGEALRLHCAGGWGGGGKGVQNADQHLPLRLSRSW